MSDRERVLVWLLLLTGGLYLLWLLRHVLLPFVAGGAIAYMLDPVVDRMESRLGRTGATIQVLLLLFGGMTVFVLQLVPLVKFQMNVLGHALPQWLAHIESLLEPYVGTVGATIGQQTGEAGVLGLAGEYLGLIIKLFGRILFQMLEQGVAVINLLSLLLITPVVAFYLLRDWHQLVVTIDGWLPRRYRTVIRTQAELVNDTLSGYVRGQILVCVLLGVLYAIGLKLIGLPFGLTVGMTAGLISFVPFVGSVIGAACAIGMALVAFPDWLSVAAVAGLFVVGQGLEGYYLTPILVGERVGLHPVWVIFALLAGGTLFGFVGVLLALPGAAIIGVLIRFTIETYKETTLFRSAHGDEEGWAQDPDARKQEAGAPAGDGEAPGDESTDGPAAKTDASGSENGTDGGRGRADGG